MRRTYRSKKESASGIERRDLFQNLDDKSSAYDAFSIQNIKQTKRELSCVGSSDPQGTIAYRMRRKKYVRRIVKNVGPPIQDRTDSPAAYLTPDKSIRVNKPLDPFDMLLISSPVCSAELVKKNQFVTRKADPFDQLLPKKEGRTYTRRKPKMAKKVNYSSNSESSDSDKENSDSGLNSTDIRTHKLLVEHKVKTPSRGVDVSINNIVNNLSLINKLKNKYNTDDSFNKSIIINNRHRLTRNIQSPLLQKSPLCSTPFKVKYRGESIFKFSPIASTTEDNSPKYVIVKNNIENNNSGNKKTSIILLNTEKLDSPNVVEEKRHTSSVDLFPADNSDNAVCDKIPPPEKELDIADKLNIEKSVEIQQSSDIGSNANLSSELSSFQTTESEVFLGFSQHTIDEVNARRQNQIAKASLFDDSLPKHDTTEIDVHENHQESVNESLDDAENDITQLDALKNGNCYKEHHNSDSDITQESHNNVNVENEDSKLDIVNDSTSSSEGNQSNVSDKNDHDRLSQTSDDDKASLYDTCTSDQSSIQENESTRKPLVLLQRLNNSLFNEYYKKFYSDNSESDDKESSLNSEFTSFNDSTDSKESSEADKGMENELIDDDNDNVSEKKAHNNNDDNNKIESTDDEKSNSNNEEEQCISFVTTRRRNDATSNSMILMFNNSCDSNSSSTDCDKTVLSNNKLDKAELKYNVDENDTLIYFEANSKNNKKRTTEPSEVNDTRISFVTTRNSNVSDRKSSIRSAKSSYNPRESIILSDSRTARKTVMQDSESSRMSCIDTKPCIVLQPGKKWERSLSIYRRMTTMADHYDESILEDICTEKKGRKYRESIISTMEMQDFNSSLHNDSFNSRRSTFASRPSRSTIRIVKDPNISRISLCNTTVFDDLTGFLNEECDDTIIELSKLSIADPTHEVTVLDTFHDTPNRIATPRDYVLRRCNQTDPILFDECYPDTVLKNCHKIGEGVYGEVFLWRARDGRARVLKIVPIAGTLKVNGESQKDFHEIISEIVIAMELSALRAPIADIERHFDEGKDVEALDLHAIENATDVFNEVLAVRCVYGSYPSRLLDLWDLYDECKGSENDNPAILPVDQQYIVLELANAGQDLESYQFNNAEQAHALFLQVAYGLAVAEEAFQFEHRDLHWGNVLIAPTEQKYATFVIRGRLYRVARMGVRATVIDYSLSRVSLRLAGGDAAALYNDLAGDDSLFDAVGDYQFQVYRLMRDKLGNEWKNFEPYTNILWLHYTVDKMITALRYKRINTKIHKHYIDKLKGIKSRILDYGSAAQFVLTDNEI